MSRLEQLIEGYVAFKQALGFDFSGEAQRLRSYLESTSGGELSQDSALAWACGGVGHPRSYQIQRYETVRRFSEFAHALDSSVPALQPGLLGKTGNRVVPFIYSKEDIVILMNSARSLKSPDGLRGESLAFLIGIMSCCGLRISEALGIEDPDLDEADEKLAREAAAAYGLYRSGGSDHSGVMGGCCPPYTAEGAWGADEEDFMAMARRTKR